MNLSKILIIGIIIYTSFSASTAISDLDTCKTCAADSSKKVCSSTEVSRAGWVPKGNLCHDSGDTVPDTYNCTSYVADDLVTYGFCAYNTFSYINTEGKKSNPSGGHFTST